ncbi:hypothetical protein BX666DRAFT_2030788 [Dichotomocladium elegans]|nr:hypothetical protein BX666DRAFT_2030788 [Dichotomocladium elegans]
MAEHVIKPKKPNKEVISRVKDATFARNIDLALDLVEAAEDMAIACNHDLDNSERDPPQNTYNLPVATLCGPRKETTCVAKLVFVGCRCPQAAVRHHNKLLIGAKAHLNHMIASGAGIKSVFIRCSSDSKRIYELTIAADDLFIASLAASLREKVLAVTTVVLEQTDTRDDHYNNYTVRATNARFVSKFNLDGKGGVQTIANALDI